MRPAIKAVRRRKTHLMVGIAAETTRMAQCLSTRPWPPVPTAC